MYTVIIIADLQETYETLCFKITSFYNFFYMERWPINKKIVVSRSLQNVSRPCH